MDTSARLSNLTRHVSDYINYDWVQPEDTDFFKKQVLSRIGYCFILAPMSAVTKAIDIIFGLGATLATVATLGNYNTPYYYTHNLLGSSHTVIADPFKYALKGLNPQAEGLVTKSGEFTGVIASYVDTALTTYANDCYELGSNILTRQVLSRLTYAVAAIAAVVCRIADAIIGVGCGTLAFLTLGTCPKINNIAYHALMAPAIIQEIAIHGIQCLNPGAGKDVIMDFSPTEIVTYNSNSIDQMMDAIHCIFFSEKNVLTRDERLDFIEIFYLFLELKLIDLIQPTSFSLVCKDGVDSGEASSAVVYFFLRLLNKGGLDQNDWDILNYILYAPAILIRERILLPDRFGRMLSAIKRIELVREVLGKEDFTAKIHAMLEPLYETPILHSEVKT